MKYKDVLMFLIVIIFILSLGYTLGVNNSIWFIPVILFIIILFLYYKLWIEK